MVVQNIIILLEHVRFLISFGKSIVFESICTYPEYLCTFLKFQIIFGIRFTHSDKTIITKNCWTRTVIKSDFVLHSII